MVRKAAYVPVVPARCESCQVKEIALCQPLVRERLDVLEEFKLGHRVFSPGSSLYTESRRCTELYHLLDGWVMRHRHLESGRRQILDFELPGAFLGYQPDLNASMLHGAECLTPVSVCVFPRKGFPELLSRYPELMQRLTHLEGHRATLAYNHITNIGCRPALRRVAYLLLELYVRMRRDLPTTVAEVVELPLTQEHIADALGLTNVHVNKMLRRLKGDGVIVLRRGTLQILDPARLGSVADFDLSDFGFELKDASKSDIGVAIGAPTPYVGVPP